MAAHTLLYKRVVLYYLWQDTSNVCVFRDDMMAVCICCFIVVAHVYYL